MTVIHRSIFKKYDIRGTAEGNDAPINEDVARLVGQALATYLQRFENTERVVVGRDNRRTSYLLHKAVIDGLVMGGCHVRDLGLVSTPVMYWHAIHQSTPDAACGGLIVTGSHVGPEYNGFKMCAGSRTIAGEQILLLRSFVENGGLSFGQGSVQVDFSAYRQYINDLEPRLKTSRPLKVVIDAGNGTGGLFAPTLFKKWGHSVEACLFCQPDGNFPNHPPDPHNPEDLQALGEKVREVKADVGVAFDGDADRIAVVDEQGAPIASDRILALLARDMLKRHPGASVVSDVMSSQVLLDEIKKAGGLPFMWTCGYAPIKAKMVETHALLAGEMSGHIFMAEDYYGFDDGFFVAGRLLQLLAASSQPLSALNAQMPQRHITPEYRPACPEKDKHDIVEAVRDMLADKGEIVEIDGLRVQFKHGWGVLRASNTEPALSLRFEGDSENSVREIKQLFVDALKKFPQVAAFA
jgi:phosphomannomutase/phosphoglucomutase